MSRTSEGVRPVCNDKRRCWAKERGKCIILQESYPDGACPFCKPERDKKKTE